MSVVSRGQRRRTAAPGNCTVCTVSTVGAVLCCVSETPTWRFVPGTWGKQDFLHLCVGTTLVTTAGLGTSRSKQLWRSSDRSRSSRFPHGVPPAEHRAARPAASVGGVNVGLSIEWQVARGLLWRPSGRGWEVARGAGGAARPGMRNRGLDERMSG